MGNADRMPRGRRPRPAITSRSDSLQLVARLVGQFPDPHEDGRRREPFPAQIVELLQVGDEVFYTWQEAVEQTIDLGESSLARLAAVPRPARVCARSPARSAATPRPGGDVRGAIWFASDDASKVQSRSSAAEVDAGVFRITVKIENHTPRRNSALAAGRDEALMHGLVSTHSILSVRDGEFVSMIDPPEPYRTPGCALPQRRLLAGAGRRRG